jgi:hypothetical protein
MNGITADSMTKKGVVYKRNFGVELTALREMAKSFSPSPDLSQRLWLIGWRETLILSVFLQPLEGFTAKQAIDRIISAPQKEIIDVLCLYLLSKTEYAPALCVDLLNHENENCRVASFMLASRIYNQLTDSQIEQIIEKSVEYSETDNFQRYKSIGICLGRLCRTSNENATKIAKIVENFRQSKMPSQCAIADEVKQELDFLINL